MAIRRARSDPAAARRELGYLRVDLAVLLDGDKRGLLTCALSQRFWAVACYRLERAALLLSGPAWPLVHPLARLALAPVRPAGVEISPRARIGAGLTVYHPGLGVVVASQTVAGVRLVLTGGNCIGAGNRVGQDDRIVLGTGSCSAPTRWCSARSAWATTCGSAPGRWRRARLRTGR